MDALEIGHLVTLGLEKDESDIYVALLRMGASSAEDLADRTGKRPDAVRAAFAALTEVGLVSLVTVDRAVVVPVPPESGLELLSRRREAELLRARVATANAFTAFRRSLAGDAAEHVIEVIRGEVVVDRIYQLERSARKQVLCFDSPPYYAIPDANQVEWDNLRRGVRYRAVYATQALSRQDYLAENVLPSVRAGEEARTLPDVPVKLMIFDDECAVVSPSAPDEEVGRSALLVRSCSLLSALAGLFEMCWRAAMPFDVKDQLSGPYLQPAERRLLSLLAAGLGDEQVVRALGISRRTLFRYLDALMSRTGAANRFQLALYAVRNEWI
jgi:sugar-specific transcriptional regulator TrmB/DNA-binding CsgD family transcriptional regulator